MNKKGSSVSDVILVVILLFAVGLASLLAYKVFTDVNTNIQDKDSIGSTAKTMIQDNKDDFVQVTDGIILLIVVGLTIALVVGASMIDTHPVLFVVALIITAIAIFFAAVYSNAYDSFASDAEISGVESEYTILPVVMNNLPVIITVMAFLVIITLYSRSRGGGL